MIECMYSDLPHCYWELHDDAKRCGIGPRQTASLTAAYPLTQTIAN